VLTDYSIFADPLFLLLGVAPGLLILLFVFASALGRQSGLGFASVTLVAFAMSLITSSFTIVMAHQKGGMDFDFYSEYWVPAIVYVLVFILTAKLAKQHFSADLLGTGTFGALVLAAFMAVTYLWVRFHEFAGQF
jgi:hypothetical protein